jgi:hypothetical protein
MISWISVVFVVAPLFAFLILLVWVFSPHFSQVCQGSVNLIYFFKEPAFCFIGSLCIYIYILVSISLISALILIVSFLLLVLGFVYS